MLEPTAPHDLIIHQKQSDLIRPIPLDSKHLSDFGTFHLGQKGTKFVDHQIINTPDGFKISVDQASYGYTGVSIESDEGVQVEGLQINKESGQLFWEKPSEGQQEISIVSDFGNLGKIDIKNHLWMLENMGNEGIRGGFVRVTKDGKQRYFAVGANFKGSPDNWEVDTRMVELEPINLLSAPPPALEG